MKSVLAILQENDFFYMKSVLTISQEMPCFIRNTCFNYGTIGNYILSLKTYTFDTVVCSFPKITLVIFTRGWYLRKYGFKSVNFTRK